MAVPTHFRFTARGTFAGTPEIWSFGWHMGRVVEDGADAELDDIDESGVTTALATFFGAGIIDTTVHLVDWRAYVIGTDGRMEGNGPLLHDATGDSIAGTGTVRYPPQVAAVVSLIAANRGPAQYGRFYVPGPTAVLETDRRLSSANAQTLANAASAFLKDVSDAIDLPLELGSSAAKNVSSRGGGAGTMQTVDHVEVGRVLDTLRSRRNGMIEERYVDAQIDW